MPAWLGIGEILFVLGLALLFFGGRKIPQIGRGLGLGIRNFKGELEEPDPPEPPKEPDEPSAGRGEDPDRGGPAADPEHAEPPRSRS